MGIRFDWQAYRNLVLIEGNQLLLDVSGWGMKLRSAHQCSPPVPRANRWRCIPTLLCGKKLNCCLDLVTSESGFVSAYIRINGGSQNGAGPDQFHQPAP